MKYTIPIMLCAMLAGAAHGQSIAQVYDRPVTNAEKEMVSLTEAMPADKYNFAPTAGEFAGVRTFALQVRHLATVIYEVSSASLGEKMPVETGKNENGSDKLATKEQIVPYLKDAFALAHRAALALAAGNLTDKVKSPFGEGTITRVACVEIALWHSYDHYGQMVVYARLNGVIPPASR